MPAYPPGVLTSGGHFSVTDFRIRPHKQIQEWNWAETNTNPNGKNFAPMRENHASSGAEPPKITEFQRFSHLASVMLNSDQSAVVIERQ
jgi:hypothetical protein